MLGNLNTEWDGECRWIRDVANNIVSVHHFSRKMEVKKGQKDFLQQAIYIAKKRRSYSVRGVWACIQNQFPFIGN